MSIYLNKAAFPILAASWKREIGLNNWLVLLDYHIRKLQNMCFCYESVSDALRHFPGQTNISGYCNQRKYIWTAYYFFY